MAFLRQLSPLDRRKIEWKVEVGDLPEYTFTPYEKHLSHSTYKRRSAPINNVRCVNITRVSRYLDNTRRILCAATLHHSTSRPVHTTSLRLADIDIKQLTVGSERWCVCSCDARILIFYYKPHTANDEREDVQKKTFAKWINSQLVKNNKPPVQDLVQELRDGEVLLSLLEILTAQRYRRERGRMRVHQLNNANAALRALEAAGVRLVNISGADIVDGNAKLILGLVWSIILHWQVHCHLRELLPDVQQSNLEKTLLAWCRAHTQNYAGVDIRDFTRSWRDGLALNALLHRWRPQLFDYAAVTPHPP
ncbi:Dystrophin [Papilio machaon]|uniref:Dystrophin n=1 Tax=Papilio machaon TaxID=76193 RepID=A0A194RDW3_PAPMA|nr:Dystrophin [Papilio machaon]